MEFHFRHDLPKRNLIFNCLRVSNNTRSYIRMSPAGMLIQVVDTLADVRRAVLALSPDCFTTFNGHPITIGFLLQPFLEELSAFLLQQQPGRPVRIREEDTVRLDHLLVNILPVDRLHISHGRYVRVTGEIFRQLFIMGREVEARWNLNSNDPVRIFVTITSGHLTLEAYAIVSRFSREHLHYWMSGDVGDRAISLEFRLTPQQSFAAFSGFAQYVVIYFDGDGMPPVLRCLGDLFSVCFTGLQMEI